MFETTSTLMNVALLAGGGMFLLAGLVFGGAIHRLLILAIVTAVLVLPSVVTNPGGHGPMPQLDHDPGLAQVHP